MNTPAELNIHFVDEAGDLTLFNKRGASVVGKEGVSSCFILGVVRIPDVLRAHQLLTELRAKLVRDPYFAGVPSMSPEEKKTAWIFHAKDDLPEVRREVFQLLPQLGAQVQAVVRRKSELVVEARALFSRGLKLRSDEVYDQMVKGLFKNILDDAVANAVIFARRGKSARIDALTSALETTDQACPRYQVGVTLDPKTWKDENGYIEETLSILRAGQDTSRNELRPNMVRSVSAAYPHQHVGLQVADYYLWSLQRLLERGEDRFFNLVANDFRLIMDLDDKRSHPEGQWYSPTHPLTLEKLMPRAS